MKKHLVVMGLMVGLMFPVAVQAQGPGGGGPRQRTMKMRLGGLIRGIGELEKAKKAPLTKDQAKKIVTAINPWKARPKMTEDEAKALFIKVNGTLTTKQKNELDKMAALRRRLRGNGEGGGRPGGGGPGGAGGPGGGNFNPQQMRQARERMRGFFKTYNPFYPPTKYAEFKTVPERMQDRQKRSYQATLTLLGQLSKKEIVR